MSTTQQAPPPTLPPEPKPFWSVKVTAAIALNVDRGGGNFEAVTAATVESVARHEDAAWAFDQAVSQVRALAPVLQTGMPAEKAIEKGGGTA